MSIKSYTVVIATPIVQCGHSVEDYIDKGFVFLSLGCGQTLSQVDQTIERMRVYPRLKSIDVYGALGSVGRSENRVDYQYAKCIKNQ